MAFSGFEISEEVGGGEVRRFEASEKDVAEQLELPRTLFGRETEIRWLEEAVEAVASARRPAVRLIAGYSGVGKTALAEELRVTVLRRGGLFAAGAYPRSCATPYGAILTALRGLVLHKLGERPERVRAWTRRLRDELGTNLGVLTQALPELLSLVGDPPPVPRVPPENAGNRFQVCVSRALGTLVGGDARAPVIVFLDDLQWVDTASLDLLSSLLSGDPGACLLLGAYRDHEVDDDHLLTRAMTELSARAVDIDTLRLMPLGEGALGQLVAGALRLPSPEVVPLAEVMYRKTAGNPFFARAFLRSVFQHRLLRLEATGTSGSGSPRWIWDLERIAAIEATENVVELVASQLAELPPVSRRTLAMASVLGKEVDAPTLAAVCQAGEGGEQTEKILIDACQQGFLVKLEAPPRYAFVHDRVREGAYELLCEEERGEVHLRIGRLLRDDVASGRDVFEAVDHLNRAAHLITDPAERSELVRLGAEAGRRAKTSGAFPAAFTYLSRALELLVSEAAESAADTWDEHYELTRTLHAEAAEAASLTGDFETAVKLCDELIANARSLLDAVPAYETRIYVLYSRRDGEAAKRLALEVLGKLGVEIPLVPETSDLRAAVLAADRAVERVLAAAAGGGVGDLPVMRDPAHLATARLLMRTAMITAWTPSHLFRLIICRLAELTTAHGVGPISPLAFALMADVRCSELEDFAGGHRVGKLALELADLPDAGSLKTTCQTLFSVVVGARSVHPATLQGRFAEHFLRMSESGDLIAAAGAGFHHSLAGLVSGTELTRVVSSSREYYVKAQGMGQQMIADAIEVIARLAGVLLGRCHTEQALGMAHADPETAAGFRLRVIGPEMMVRCLLRDPRALATARESQAMLKGMLPIFPFDFYRCLIFLDCGAQDDPEIDAALARLERLARVAPEIYQHKVDLVRAHTLRAAGRTDEAFSFYEKAADGACQGGFLHEKALAGELAAELHHEIGRERDAAVWLRAAVSAYRRWGARAKVDQLLERFPDLLATSTESERSPDVTSLERALKQEVESRRRAEADLRRALDVVAALKDRLEAENLYLQQEIQSHFEEIVGDSEAMRKVLYKVEQVAATDATVLILGETGTGKELIARALHRLSPRRERPLVKVNCAALPANLIESELFGHEKGAFTGALARKAGRFELADSGTLFLDEIGDLPPELQVKLLRVLQEGEFERLGGAKPMRVDVRIIAATNRDLERAMAEGTFRSDLYYRLTVFPVELPPLRERDGDVPLLVRHFIGRKRGRLGSQVEKVTREAMERLAGYPWPGNVRELENVIERALILSSGATLHLEESFAAGKTPPESPECLADLERLHIGKILEACDWKIKGRGNAAERLEIAPATLRGRMKKLGLRRPLARPEPERA